MICGGAARLACCPSVCVLLACLLGVGCWVRCDVRKGGWDVLGGWWKEERWRGVVCASQVKKSVGGSRPGQRVGSQAALGVVVDGSSGWMSPSAWLQYLSKPRVTNLKAEGRGDMSDDGGRARGRTCKGATPEKRVTRYQTQLGVYSHKSTHGEER